MRNLTDQTIRHLRQDGQADWPRAARWDRAAGRCAWTGRLTGHDTAAMGRGTGGPLRQDGQADWPRAARWDRAAGRCAKAGQSAL